MCSTLNSILQHWHPLKPTLLSSIPLNTSRHIILVHKVRPFPHHLSPMLILLLPHLIPGPLTLLLQLSLIKLIINLLLHAAPRVIFPSVTLGPGPIRRVPTLTLYYWLPLGLRLRSNWGVCWVRVLIEWSDLGSLEHIWVLRRCGGNIIDRRGLALELVWRVWILTLGVRYDWNELCWAVARVEIEGVHLRLLGYEAL